MLNFLKRIENSIPSLPTISYQDRKAFDQIYKKLDQAYPHGTDAWGLNVKKAKRTLETIYPIYKHYFKVRTFGSEHVKDQNYMAIANHSGPIAIDAMLICTSFVTEVEPPRILRSMVERFVTSLPFFGPWSAEGGSVLGDRQNCINLLNRKQSVLVFPEGVRGITKDSKDYYKLQSFTHGFYRLALATKVPILPIAVIGAEEFYPFVYHARSLAKLVGLPALPISTNLIPLPSPVDIHIGKPIMPNFNLEYNSPDKDIAEEVFKIEKIIQNMIRVGLKKRRPFWVNREYDV